MNLTPYNVENNAAGFGGIGRKQDSITMLYIPSSAPTIRGWSFHGVILYTLLPFNRRVRQLPGN
jgi:hypothetical protein